MKKQQKDKLLLYAIELFYQLEYITNYGVIRINSTQFKSACLILVSSLKIYFVLIKKFKALNATIKYRNIPQS